MFTRYRIAAIAFGLVLSVGAIAQESKLPSAQRKPETAAQQQKATPASEGDTTPEPDNSENLLPAIQGIETAIRELIADEDKIAAEEDRRRDQADLKAQESMAIWAFWMFIAAAASVVMTFIGLLLLWRTLEHTKRAAIHAGDAVNEARNATVAAHDAVRATREIGNSQLRAYLSVEIASLGDISKRKPHNISAKIKFVNHGQTPARNISFAVTLEVLPRHSFDQDEWNIGLSYAEEAVSIQNSIHPSGGVMEASFPVRNHVTEKQHTDAIQSTEYRYFIIGRIDYTDVFGEAHWTEFALSYADTGKVGRKVVNQTPGIPGLARWIPEYRIYEWQLEAKHNDAS